MLFSPYCAPSEILAKFPKVRVVAAENDPLRLSAMEFALKLEKAGVDVKIKVLKEFIHGYSHLDLKYVGVKEFSRGI